MWKIVLPTQTASDMTSTARRAGTNTPLLEVAGGGGSVSLGASYIGSSVTTVIG
jgi:hypothetical protein